MRLHDDMTIKELLTQAWRRIDGIVMCIACMFFVAFAAYAAIAKYMGIVLFMPYSKAISSVLLVPVIFVAYVRLAYFSTSGKISRAINAVILLAVPFLFFYKSLY